MLASFEYCKARCDVSLLVACLHSLVFCNTRIICAFEGELSGAFARLAKLAPLPQKLIVRVAPFEIIYFILYKSPGERACTV